MSRLWSSSARSSLVRSFSGARRALGLHYESTRGSYQGSRLFGSAAASEPDYDPSEARTPPSEKIQRIADEISTLSLLEVVDLSTLLKKKLGLPAGMGMMPMGMMPPGMGMPGGGAAPAAEEKKPEKTSFDVKLEKFDAASKIKIIKEVRTFTALGLKEAKELVEKAPIVLKNGVSKEEAEQIIEKLKSVGATVVME
ncbi:hypothetical protein M758_4G250900 [Ceratodon purpureus]|uniref:Ribosomal protein L7/L12 C-terminal domain-containing protein n=1 Tax=Ceratodon purpureus TaxID=3225 RepID=A0A8T0ICA0_CERPU|nr:hypothetical protein KC19_4G246300 [Ceratodon purpureus]KAG0620867.1 hypothetical protein M758_4G250900 [Ceratodon purpureus]KAG0620868.1 hypothetical protein M758_4G250900 [Ceratodon purpureus]KAG0620869.1 hypothetical protein M758_4G250900 [Ceratodon purpureus]KAG0620870.1 hypothetical protein M758_4G250900 [Ceratodon purpureus]